jgi:hypothetical protein
MEDQCSSRTRLLPVAKSSDYVARGALDRNAQRSPSDHSCRPANGPDRAAHKGTREFGSGVGQLER